MKIECDKIKILKYHNKCTKNMEKDCKMKLLLFG